MHGELLRLAQNLIAFCRTSGSPGRMHKMCWFSRCKYRIYVALQLLSFTISAFSVFLSSDKRHILQAARDARSAGARRWDLLATGIFCRFTGSETDTTDLTSFQTCELGKCGTHIRHSCCTGLNHGYRMHICYTSTESVLLGGATKASLLNH